MNLMRKQSARAASKNSRWTGCDCCDVMPSTKVLRTREKRKWKKDWTNNS